MKVKDPDQLKRWRNRRRLNQRDLAYLSKCSQTTIYLLETGRMTTLSSELARRIADRLDVPWEDLFEDKQSFDKSAVTTGVRTAGQNEPRRVA